MISPPKCKKEPSKNKTRAPENCHRLQCKNLFNVADLVNGSVKSSPQFKKTFSFWLELCNVPTGILLQTVCQGALAGWSNKNHETWAKLQKFWFWLICVSTHSLTYRMWLWFPRVGDLAVWTCHRSMCLSSGRDGLPVRPVCSRHDGRAAVLRALWRMLRWLGCHRPRSEK